MCVYVYVSFYDLYIKSYHNSDLCGEKLTQQLLFVSWIIVYFKKYYQKKGSKYKPALIIIT